MWKVNTAPTENPWPRVTGRTGPPFRSLAGEIDTTPPAGQLIVQVMAGPRKASAKHLERMERLASGVLVATRGRFRCSEITGPSRRGRMWVSFAALSNVCVAVFLHFVSFQISASAILLLSLRKIFPTDHLKRNALPSEAKCPLKRARYRRLKNARRSGMASGKKPFARRDVLRSCTRNSRTRSADQVRQIAASIRVSGFTGPVLFAGGNTVIAGAGPCADGAGDGHGCCALHPAARSPG